jgi:amino acid adenylation domain-containing protein
MKQINVLDYLYSSSQDLSSVAIRCRDSSLTFKELHHSVGEMADFLNQFLPNETSPVATLLDRGIDCVIANLGIMKLGHYFTNIDPKTPIDRFANLLGNLENPVLITSHANLAKIPNLNHKSRVIFIDDFYSHKEQGIISKSHLKFKGNENVSETNPICIYNTSGSTGVPKSVVITHAGVIDYIEWVTSEFDFSDKEVFGSITPFHFDHYTLDLFVALKIGAELVIVPDELIPFPTEVVSILESSSATFLFWVPTIMVNVANLDLLSNRNLSSIKKVFFAGEVLPTKHLRYWQEKLPHVTFVNLYGPTEATTDCTFKIIERKYEDEETLSIGKPCRNSDVFILTSENAIAEVDEVGEICIRGVSLALGYFNNDEQTANSFVQNPLNQNYPDRIYRTGDLGKWSRSGEIVFLGRKDFQIKHSGYRVELGEIETALLRIAEVQNVCVLYDNLKKEIVAICESKVDLDLGDMRKFLSKDLPKYMIPTQIHRIDEIPMNSNGKIDRKLLSSRFISVE